VDLRIRSKAVEENGIAAEVEGRGQGSLFDIRKAPPAMHYRQIYDLLAVRGDHRHDPQFYAALGASTGLAPVPAVQGLHPCPGRTSNHRSYHVIIPDRRSRCRFARTKCIGIGRTGRPAHWRYKDRQDVLRAHTQLERQSIDVLHILGIHPRQGGSLS